MKHIGGSILFIALLTAFLIIAGTIGYTIVQKKKESETNPFYYIDEQNKNKHDRIVIDYTNEQTAGNREAVVHVVQFADFKCPGCKEWSETVLPKLKEEYISAGTVQLHFMNFAFIGADSKLAAQAGEAIYKQSETAFWKFHDVMYANQQERDKAWVTEELIVQIVQKHLPEVNMRQFQQDWKSDRVKQLVQQDLELALELKASGVPAIYVNGQRVSSEYEQLKAAIDAASTGAQ